MKNGRMQAKDVPDLPVLEFIHRVQTEGVQPPPGQMEWSAGERWHHVTWFNYGDEIPTNSVMRAMPEGTPEKVVLAKMRRLIERELVDGCPCGCRGDFELTDKGREMIGAPAAPDPITSPRYFAEAFDAATWDAKLQQLVTNAVLSVYIDSPPCASHASIGVVKVDPNAINRALAAAGYSVSIVTAPVIDRERMFIHTLHDAGVLITGLDISSDRLEIDLSGSGELGPAYDFTWDGRKWDTRDLRPIAAPPLKNEPDYLRHDPTKRVDRRRRQSFRRKGTRP